MAILAIAVYRGALTSSDFPQNFARTRKDMLHFTVSMHGGVILRQLAYTHLAPPQDPGDRLRPLPMEKIA